MRPLGTDHLNRRAFLRRTGQLAMTGTALPLALNLAAFGEAAALAANDYKALVCVFLNGGNDHANTVVPYDNASYNQYSAIRGGGANQSAGGIALARGDLTATLLAPLQAPGNGLQFALHPNMAGMASLFNAGHMAVQLNVGPLVQPTTRAQYNLASFPRPSKLFSHSDQTSVWQSSMPEGATIGWGGRMGDFALSGNSDTLFTCISAAGNAVFMAGTTALNTKLPSTGRWPFRNWLAMTPSRQR